MKIFAYNPGHDGAIAYLKDSSLVFSIEAEKNSNWRYSPISSRDIIDVLGKIDDIPDVICTGGWWPRDHNDYLYGNQIQYRGITKKDVSIKKHQFMGKQVYQFSSTHERSHILSAYGMSDLPLGTHCYALVWEGEIGAFYEIDSELNITKLSEVLSQVGNRYAALYGLADPTFPKDGPFPRVEDSGKFMALTSFSVRSLPTIEESKIMDCLLDGPRRELSAYPDLIVSRYNNIGLDDPEFRNFAGIYSDKIFDMFYKYAKTNLTKNIPLIIAGGCGLNCDWNTKWRSVNLFSEIFVPPVANDSGSAIGTAIDAQFHLTGNPKINWNVYSGIEFDSSIQIDESQYDIFESGYQLIADMLVSEMILGWVNGKYEIGPRALGNRSIIASPFREEIKHRLNVIKQREQFRPIAPVCLEEDAIQWFDCQSASPHMLYTFKSKTDALAAVTHVNKTARIQTVSISSNPSMYNLLKAFKSRTNYGVLCNTSLNYKGKGFINKIDDLSRFSIEHKLDGFVINGKAYILKSSVKYLEYLRMYRDIKL